MKNSLFGVIIKVNDISLCRNFYRDILNLGDPVVDSNFCVEFQVNKDFSLSLEKTEARFLEHESSATSWVYRVANLAEVSKRFYRFDYSLELERRLHDGEALYRCRDPENNIFYLISNESE